MKRLIGLSVAVILGVTLTTVMLIPKEAKAVGGLLFGLPVSIGFDEGHFVNQVDVQVNNGWLNSDKFSLAITIDGINDGPHEHGYQEVPLSATEVLGDERSTANVRVDWNTDTSPTHTSETYHVCVQILVNGNPVGEPMCDFFGPY